MIMVSIKIALVLCVVFGQNVRSSPERLEDGLQLTIVHFNDFHARFEEQSPVSGVCKPSDVCHGGFARLYEAIMSIMSSAHNPLLLNAGDNFQGTLWYTLFRWNVTQHFMNMLPIKAHAIGNHEFDDKVEGLIPFLQAMKAPAVACNMNDTLVPSIQGLYRKSVTFDVQGKKIAIVGVMLSTTNEISNSGDLSFLDEVASVNEEVERLVKEEDIFTAIVLSHAGYQTDMRIARMATRKISLIVGGHSHTFLNNGTGEDGTVPEGTYPTVIKRELDGQMIPVVQAASYTKYLGNFSLTLGANGEALTWEGKPIYLAPTLPKNAKIVELMQPWQQIVTDTGEEVFGSTEVVLEAETCRILECNFGNLVTDAMVWFYKSKVVGKGWTNASLAIINSGGIRATIPVGNITYNDMVTSQPFANTWDVGVLKGAHIRTFLERAATPFRFRNGIANVHLLQLSGFKVVYDLSRPEDSRVVSVEVICAQCDAAKYEPLDDSRDYRIIVPSFLVAGGDGFAVISDNLREHVKGPLDMAVFRDFLPQVSPVNVGIEGRITFVGHTRPRRTLT